MGTVTASTAFQLEYFSYICRPLGDCTTICPSSLTTFTWRRLQSLFTHRSSPSINLISSKFTPVAAVFFSVDRKLPIFLSYTRHRQIALLVPFFRHFVLKKKGEKKSFFSRIVLGARLGDDLIKEIDEWERWTPPSR